jgi:hypothetical protein
MIDEDTDMEMLRSYVRTMLNNGYDALELEVFVKKFKHMDCVRLLTKIGCEVIEDLVLLRLPNSDDDDDDFFV